MKPRLCVLLALAVVPLTGCGSDGGSKPEGQQGGAPATLVPAAAPVYFEAVLRPDGDLGDGATDALKKILRTDDPGKKITGLLDRQTSRRGLRWDDLKQWLGQRVGVFLTEFGGDKMQGAAVIETTDTDKAKSAIEKFVTRRGSGNATPKSETYKGVEMQVSSGEDFATAIVADHAVFGSVGGVKQVVDTSTGARPLTDVADYTAARGAVGAGESLAVGYVAPQALIDAISPGAGASGTPLSDPRSLTVFRQLAAKAGRAAAVALHADGHGVRIDAAAIGAAAGTTGTAAADALAALPADAWLAVGFGDLGSTLSRTLAQISQISSLGGRGPDLSALLEGFKTRTGVDIQRDFLSWMGDGAVYARGHSLGDIGGVLTIESKDAAKSRHAVAIIGRALQRAGASVRKATVDGYDTAIELRSASVPVSLFIAANGDRFSAGVNPKALSDVAGPSDRLGGSATYDQATATLGGDLKPVLILDTPTIVNLLESFGIGKATGFAQVKPYLDVFGPLSAGTARDGDVAKASLALALR